MTKKWTATKTGIQPKHHTPAATVPMGKYAIIALACVGACLISLCGWKCWIESRENGYDRLGRRYENRARLNDNSGWEYAHEKAD